MIDYFEVLICWDYLVEGFIVFDEFILIVEELNLILDLGDWIMFELC